VDELTFNVPTSNVLGTAPFAYGETVALFRDGARWFTGTVTAVKSLGTAQSEMWSVVVSGPWWQLQRIIYQQWMVLQNEGFSCLLGAMTTRVALMQDQWGNKITIAQQIFQIGVYALYKGASLFAFSSIPFTDTPPVEECKDITCAEAIKRCLRYIPDASAWFDYSTPTPVLYIQNRPYTASVVQPDLADTNLVEHSEVTPRYDLKIPGALFIYLTATVNPADGQSYTVVTRDSVGYGDTVAGCVVATFELTGQNGGAAETPPTGLAATFYNALQTLYWSGTVRLHEVDCSGLLRPGRQLNLLSGPSVWASMYTPIQTVDEDIDHGITTASFGPPDQLGPQDFFTLQQFFRNRATPTAWSSVQHNGTAGLGACVCGSSEYAAAVDAVAAAAADPTNVTKAVAAMEAQAACGPMPKPDVPPVPNQAGAGSTSVAGQPPKSAGTKQGLNLGAQPSIETLELCDGSHVDVLAPP
jgi:hypothetical protein